MDLRRDGGRAGGLPISVRRADGGPDGVRVEVFDRDITRRLGVAGVLLGVSRADEEPAAAPVRVAIDYSGFRAAFGGAYDERLRLLRFPACAVTTPEVASCVTGTPVPGDNNKAEHSFAAEVEAAAGIAEDTTVTAGMAPRQASGFVYALAAGPSGGTGDYTATQLSSAAEWSGGGSSGQFAWSYPMRTPPSPAGAAPELGLSYSSGAVDGATAAENNQSGPAGMGFDLGTSFIERRYAACAYNGHAGGDLCWKYDNASLVLNGVSTELVRESDGVWHARKDSGWRIERFRTGDLPGRDNDDERWIVTTQDGTRYHFGLSRQPSTLKPTHSTWTVPVFGLKAEDPCWSGNWATSSCEQAWRWNLDYVQDRNGNSTTYFYEEEGNYYGRNGDVYDQAYYIRGGNLIKIEYGTREFQENAGPSAWVNLSYKFRCAGGADECGAPTKENAAKFPDTPLDMLCTNTQPCQNHSPTFFSIKRLNGVATYVYNPADTVDHAQNVDAYDLDFAFYGPNDGTVDPILYLTNIKRSGSVGGSVTLEPGTWFDYGSQQHRVDVDTANGSPTLIRHHLANVYDDFGSRIDVTYGQPHPCSAASLPAEHANGTDCFRAWYKPENKPAKFGWFRKFLVTKVSEVDRTGLSPARATTYAYNDAPAWHFDNRGTLTPIDQQSWGQWRGHASVSSFHGNSGPTQSVESFLYFRGMNGDRLNRAGGAKTVELSNSKGVKNLDHDMVEGQLWERRRWNGSTTDELSSSINSFWVDKTWDGGSVDSYIVQVGQTDTRIEAKVLPGQMRYTRTKTEFESGTGLPVKEIDFGEVTSAGADVGGDETCTSTEYARNTQSYRFFEARVQTRKGAGCVATDQLVSRTETYHDYHAGPFDVPTNGRPTAVRAYVSDAAFVENKTEYDMYGRATKTIDAEGRTNTTAYEPSGLRPTTKIAATNPKGWQTVTTMAPWWSKPTSVVDVNGKRTDIDYDAIGRTTKVWNPDQPRSANPNTPSAEFSYGVSPYTPNWTRTRSLHKVNAGSPAYLDSWSYVDGFGGASETQVSAPGSGRIVTHKGYDDRGLLYWDSAPMHNAANAGSGILNPASNTVPSRMVMFYDTLERQTSAQLWSIAAKKWETTTAHDGDRTTETPPVGGAVTAVVDAHGRTVLSRSYDGPATSTTFRDTVTTYHPSGTVATVTDPAGNVTTYGHDLLGRVTETTEPNSGKTTVTYTKTGQAASVTDARGRTVSTGYDELNRRTGLFEGPDASGTKLASWTYDPAGAQGQLASATVYLSDRAYTSTVTGYDDAYRPLGTSVVIPSQEGALAGTYSSSTTYDKAGRVATVTHPAAGGLADETVTSTYTEYGQPNTLTGTQVYVGSTGFDQLGRLVDRQYGAAPGPIRRYGYDDSTGRLAFGRALKGGTNELLLERQYTYDQAGNPTQVAESAGTLAAPTTPTLSARECFRHNAFQQLTTAWTTTAADCASEPAAGAANGVDPFHLAWEVNAIGNRTKETDRKTGQVRDYTYPAAGQPRPHAVTTIGADRFEYDTSGKSTLRIVGGATQSLDWDVLGRLAKLADSTKGETSFVYDADGTRLIRRDPNGTTLYLGATELHLPAGGQPKATRYYTQGDVTVAVRTPAGVQWQLSDRQDSAELSIEATTGKVSRRRYLPYGGDRSTADSWPTERGFLNKTKDTSTGLSHLDAREYDPSTGQFLSVDPMVGETGTPYGYAANNPVTYSDPTGLAYEECTSGQYVCRGGTQVVRKGKNYAIHKARIDRDNQVYARNYQNYRAATRPCPAQCVKARQERARTGGSANAVEERERRKTAAAREIAAKAEEDAIQKDGHPVGCATGKAGAYKCVHGLRAAPDRCGDGPRQVGCAAPEFNWPTGNKNVFLTVSVCDVLCANATVQGEWIIISGGGAGVGASGVIGVANATPEEMDPASYSSCAGAAFTGCAIWGGRNRGSGLWSAVAAGIGLQAKAGANYAIVMINTKSGTVVCAYCPPS
ncbi:MAG: RHS repeat-associated core domain-containing protein [Umezawaea sp.]